MFSLFIDYTSWHYSYALLNILRLGKEFIRFFFNLFSVPLFIRSFFSPIFSVSADLGEADDGADTVALIISAVLMRVLGMILRSIFIVLGLFFSSITFVFFVCIFLLWLVTPIVFVVSVYYLFVLTFK